ncbi:MAG: flagellar export protein FliJ [Gammaproteobacteria bacterium]|nr:MAG: flagellar export protein FliJ [Gammaproteobacteria bacterium]
MKRSRRFLPVVEQARRREQEAARRLGEAQARWRQAEAQLRQLAAYRDEYAKRLETCGTVAAARLRDYLCFLERLNQAIDQQRALLERLEGEVEARRETWQGLHARRRALDRVREGYLREERREAERRDQRRLDELALAMHRRHTKSEP